MAGQESILSLLNVFLGILAIVVIGGVFVQLAGPIYDTVVDVALITSLGWGAPQDVALLFASLAFIGLILMILWWWIVKAIRDDVRQEGGRGGF